MLENQRFSTRLPETRKAQAENFPLLYDRSQSGRGECSGRTIGGVVRNIRNRERSFRPQIEFVDIAGLVKGASEGQGLGKQIPRQHSGSRRGGSGGPLF